MIRYLNSYSEISKRRDHIDYPMINPHRGERRSLPAESQAETPP